MADYNVQMKQYNGTSFDNILPYASQALTLAGGGGATEIIAQARAGLSQIATGSYVGTGTYGASNPTVITCGFKPKYVVILGKGANDLSVGESNCQMRFGTNMTNLGTGTTVQLLPSVCSRLASVTTGNFYLTNDCIFIDCESQGNIFMFHTSKSVFLSSIMSTYEFPISVVMVPTLSNSGISLVSEQYMIGKYGFDGVDYSSLESRTPASQMNENGVVYYYVALG